MTKLSDMMRDPLLVEREKTHGSFEANARVYETMVACGSWQGMSVSQRHAMRMIMVKIGRVLSGNPDIKDHWDDIAGYAKLGAEACE